MTPPPRILHIAVPSPLFTGLDYLAPAGIHLDALQAGMRVRVPFGRRQAIGVLLETRQESALAPQRLKQAEAILDDEAVIDPELLHLARWAADYYHHPIGEVLAAVLPVALRKGQPARVDGITRWRLTPAGRAVDLTTLGRAPRQAAVLQALQTHADGLSRTELEQGGSSLSAILRNLADKGWVEAHAGPCLSAHNQSGSGTPLALSAHQQTAVSAVSESLGSFQPFLLDGITGSGKTEVYLQLVEAALARGEQALVLVPEIGLTPQMVQRFQQRFPVPLAVLHSGLTERERLCAWLMARDGRAPIVLGTRSAAFTPLKRPGLFIVDEEHDASFKQHEGFRYSARDLLLVRARAAGAPVLLGSATPSLESLFNVAQGRYTRLELPRRSAGASSPRVGVLDLKGQPMEAGLSRSLMERIGEHLAREGQVLVFLNRRGFAPTLLCHACGWVAQCRRCDARMTLHQGSQHLRCHHCGAQRPIDRRCGDCGSEELRPVGQGTERLEEVLQRRFPAHPVARIDRDSTRRKGSLEALLEQAHTGESRILLGTQMLAKGHHFPNVTLVAIVNADGGLFSADLRGTERMAQLIVQVAGRAGRAERPGEVLIQTHHPDHPLLQHLLHGGYGSFARAALAERREAGLPPYASLALLRAEAPDVTAPTLFLEQARDLALSQLAGHAPGSVATWGPVPAPMERRGGRYRAQLMLQATRRTDLQHLLGPWVEALGQLPGARKVRWSIDVDPVDTL